MRLEIDASTFLLKLDDCWFLVGVAPFPERTFRGAYEPCFDVVLKRKTLRMNSADDHERARLYGRTDLYAVSKRQISRREMARFGVTSR